MKGSLKEVTTTEKDAKYKISRLPGDELRILDEEAFGPEYSKADIRSTDDSDASPFEKKFHHIEDKASDMHLEDDDETEGGKLFIYFKKIPISVHFTHLYKFLRKSSKLHKISFLSEYQ